MCISGGLLDFANSANVAKVTVMFALTHMMALASSSAAPEDWVSGSPFAHFTSDDSRADTFTSAYLNVSLLTDDGWKWDKTEVGRFGGGYVGPASGIVVHISSQSNPDDHTGCEFPWYSSNR